MSEKNSKENQEIDAFAKALLHKKTEMALYKDQEQKEEEKRPMTKPERQYAEKTMSSALDLLRKERGQLTIEEEEEQYRQQNEEQVQHIQEVEDFTTDSIHQEPNLDQNDMLASIYSSIETPKKEEKKKTTFKKPRKVKEARKSKEKKEDKKAVKQKEETKNDTVVKKVEEEKPKKEKKKKEPKEPNFFTIYKKWIIIGVLVFAALLGAYAYKVTVYDPNNVASEEQNNTYAKLVEYADEWDMLSEAEKMEIIDLEDAYNNLLPKQKDQINDYFKEQTKETFTAQLEALKALKTTQEDETRPEYQNLVGYVSNWSTKPDEEKAQIIQYKDTYNSLSTALKQKIDQICMEQAGATFNTLVAQEEESQAQANAQAQEEAQKAQEAQQAQQAAQEQRDQIQAQIDSLQAQLNDAVVYKADLEAQQAGGEDVSAMIATNDQTIAYLNEQIAQLQYQMASIQ